MSKKNNIVKSDEKDLVKLYVPVELLRKLYYKVSGLDREYLWNQLSDPEAAAVDYKRVKNGE